MLRRKLKKSTPKSAAKRKAKKGPANRKDGTSDAKAILAKMKAKEASGDCAFC